MERAGRVVTADPSDPSVLATLGELFVTKDGVVTVHLLGRTLNNGEATPVHGAFLTVRTRVIG